MAKKRCLRTVWAAGLAAAALTASAALAEAALSARKARAPVEGLWLTGQAEARIRISSCGATFCGTIIGLKAPIDARTGKPVTDANNPDPRNRLRPLIGLTILDGVEPVPGTDTWKGRIYNAENGKLYDVTLSPEKRDRLRVEGCLLVFCSGETWRRIGQ